MTKKIYIGLAAFTGITLGILIALKLKKRDLNKQVEITEDAEDSYADNVWSASEKATDAYKESLHEWGTKEGLINVGGNGLNEKESYKKLLHKRDTKEGLINVGVNSLIEKESHKESLHKWGTKEGLIDVGDNSLASKKTLEQKRLIKFSEIEKQGNLLTKLHQKYQESKPFQSIKNLDNEYKVTQVIINNNTSLSQPVSLWGGNSEVKENTVNREEENFTARIGVHPQNTIYNPANGLFYVVNQLSDSVSVVDDNGKIVATILLSQSLFLGIVSPVDLSVNTNVSSVSYGRVYVIGSVSNKVYEITIAHKINNTYEVGNRPISIAFNKRNNSFYVANLVSDSLTKLDFGFQDQLVPEVSTIKGFNAPKRIGVHQGNGNVYVFNGTSRTLKVIDQDDTVLKGEIKVTTDNGSFTYHVKNEQIYFSQATINNVIVFDALTQEISAVIKVGKEPVSLAYHSINGLLYVGNRLDQNYSVISSENEVVNTIDLGMVNNGLAISTDEDTVLSTDTASDSFFIKKANTPVITFDEDYFENRKDFQHNPAFLGHVKVISSGSEKLNTMEHIKRSITGKEQRTSYSFRNYESPQHFNNVSELTDLKNKMIDGNNSWNLNIPPNQRVTLLFYYKEIEVYDLLPETSRKSIGVEMSKGIPKKWI